MTIQSPITHPTEDSVPDYARDVYAWALFQRNALERRDVAALDWDNLLEEMDGLGNSQLGEMENRLVTILEHMLKYEFGLVREPARGWKRTVAVQRTDLARHLRRNPSLASRLGEIAREVYPDARSNVLASFEEYEPQSIIFYANLLPLTLPYVASRLLDPDYLLDPRD